MSHEADRLTGTKPRPRVVKAPAVRRAELIDCAQGLFLRKGYEKTTINDVIAATGLSKGAFYHHFRAKEDLLEAIAERYGRDALANGASVLADTSLGALQRLNAVLAMGREWKLEHLAQLRAMFAVLLGPENAVLYYRIINAIFSALVPVLTAIIEEGEREGVFDVADARTAADTLLWLGEGRRTILVQAMASAAEGDAEEAARLLLRRFRAEELVADRVLGLPPGSVQLVGTDQDLRAVLVAWVQAPEPDEGSRESVRPSFDLTRSF